MTPFLSVDLSGRAVVLAQATAHLLRQLVDGAGAHAALRAHPPAQTSSLGAGWQAVVLACSRLGHGPPLLVTGLATLASAASLYRSTYGA
jgi:hypothetical protein